MQELAGKVVLITGGGRGIGRAVASFLARQNVHIVINDLGCDVEGRGADPNVVQETVESIRTKGGNVIGDTSDASAPDAASRLIEVALEHFGRLDAVIGSTGLRRDRSVLRVSDADLQDALEVQFLSQARLIRAATEHWSHAGIPGNIVLLSGASAFFGAGRQGAVAAGHSALVAFARCAAVELRRYHIRINVVLPTARTRLTQDLPLFRNINEDALRPDHVATLIAYLISDKAKAVHGEVLGVAGGRIYSVQNRETAGAFREGRGFRFDEIEQAWAEITRGSLTPEDR